MSNIKLYIIKFAIIQFSKSGIAQVTATSAKRAQEILQAQGKFNGYKYAMEYPELVHTTDTFTAEAVISEIDNSVGSTGPQGPKGDKGDPGPQGEKGEKGDPGIDLVGYYPKMSVGMADNLVGRGDIQDAYINFRPSGGKNTNISDGTARIRKIKGNSVVWNQKRNEVKSLSAYGYECSTIEGSTKVIIENRSAVTPDFGNLGVIPDFTPIASHKYIVLSDSHLELAMTTGANFTINTNNIGTAPDLEYSNVYIRTNVAPTLAVGESETFSFDIIDLTQMFGAGKEPTSVDDFNSRIPLNIDPHVYNEGEVIHMKIESLESIGDNIWDEEWENGTFNTTTGESLNTPHANTQIRSKNLIKIIPNTTYGFLCATTHTDATDDLGWVIFLDKNGDVISLDDDTYPDRKNGNSIMIGTQNPFNVLTSPPQAAYMKFYISGWYGNIYENNISVSLVHSGYKFEADTSGKYYKHEVDTKNLSFICDAFPDGMRAVGNAFDEIRFNNSTSQWEKVKNIGVIKLGELTWSVGWFTSSEGYRIYAPLPGKKFGTDNVLCKSYITHPEGDSAMPDISVSGNVSNQFIYIRDSRFGETGVDSLLKAIEDIDLYYELEASEVTSLNINLSPYFNMDYLVWDFGTEEAKANMPSAPFRADIIYEFNAVDDIRWAYKEISELKEKINELTTRITNLSN